MSTPAPFSYGAVTFQLVKTNELDRQSVFSDDGAELLYDRWLIDIDAIYNPYATSYSVGPTAVAGVLPAVTDANIEWYLKQPRRTLVFTNGSNEIIRSPATGYTTDAKNGPFPLRCTVKEIAGTKTFRINFRIETHLACPGTSSPPIVLSNRWEEAHTVEGAEGGYLTGRIIKGVAVLRTDELLKQGKLPDSFRNQLIRSNLPNCERRRVDVSLSSDGTRLHYTCYDQEKFFSLGAGSPAMKIEGFLTVSGADSKYTVAQIIARVWGQKQSHKMDLLILALRIVLAKLPQNADFDTGAVQQFSATFQLDGKYVEVQLIVMLPTSSKSAGGLLPVKLGADGLNLQQESVGDVLLEIETKNPPPPGDGLSRGSLTGPAGGVAYIVAAQLHDACSSAAASSNQSGTAVLQAGQDQGVPVIAVRVVADLPAQNTFYSQDALSQFYETYELTTKIKTESHVLQAPVADPDMQTKRVAAELITVAAPTSVKIVEWKATRKGAIPTIPSIDTHDPNDGPGTLEIYGGAGELMADGRSGMYAVSGRYLYQNALAYLQGDPFPLATLPYIEEQRVLTAITPSNVKDGVLGSGPVSPAQPAAGAMPAGYSTLKGTGGGSGQQGSTA